MVDEYKPDLCIYHDNCHDGFGAAWAIWKRWPDIEFQAASYGDAPPDVTGRHILIVDFSYKRAVIEQMAQDAASIVILDHHKSAIEDLEPFLFGSMHLAPCETGEKLQDTCLHYKQVNYLLLDKAESADLPVLAYFDMARSGAMLAWQFAHVDASPPLIRYIQDRDLWNFDLRQTRAIDAYLKSIERSFYSWDFCNKLLLSFESHQDICRIGDHILQFYGQTVLRPLVASAKLTIFEGQQIAVCNCPGIFASDVGNALVELHGLDIAFSVLWHQETSGDVKVSLRSGKSDVQAIAAQYGGGGHPNAAGFTVTSSEFLAFPFFQLISPYMQAQGLVRFCSDKLGHACEYRGCQDPETGEIPCALEARDLECECSTRDAFVDEVGQKITQTWGLAR